MENLLVERKANFGTLPVFLTAISTILGAIMFLRFGFAVGSVGFLGTIFIIIIGHLVTIPTAMALAEIATNQKVEGGGEYFIISRSFGINIGAAIGIALYLSQAVSVAFYIIAFAEAFDAIRPWLDETFGISTIDSRIFSIPALLLMIWLMVSKGANLGMKALYIVVSILAVALVLFFIGKTPFSEVFEANMLLEQRSPQEGFFYVFAIIFPAFTGMTAGVGLSGDLKRPGRSIPLGTLSATIIGMIIYVFIAYKLVSSAPVEDLVNDQLVMSSIALWGPIIPIGLAAATISSALGSFMVAPRTLQAIGRDHVFPSKHLNNWLSKGIRNNEPRNATILTSIIAFVFVLLGDVNAVAEIISMFFMVTYGSLCLISFLQHFSADPSYRPTFRSKWYISLLGAVLCIFLMFKINTFYAIVAIIFMVLLYFYISLKSDHKKGMAKIFQGAIYQVNRKIQVYLQKSEKERSEENWRPSVICLAKADDPAGGALQLMKWISHRYGFGTYIHFVQGYLSNELRKEAQLKLDELIKKSAASGSNVFLETIISPSNTGAMAHAIQQPGISGQSNNTILFEIKKGEREWLQEIIENYKLLKVADYDLCILANSEKGFGRRRSIHIWIRREDYENANLMILLAYIILGHQDWRRAQIKIFATFPKDELEHELQQLTDLASSGRLPISAKNIRVLPADGGINRRRLINKFSSDADLTLIGFHGSMMRHEKGLEIFEGYEGIGNILFVNTLTSKFIK